MFRYIAREPMVVPDFTAQETVMKDPDQDLGSDEDDDDVASEVSCISDYPPSRNK